MIKYLRLLPEILLELKALNSLLRDIHKRQIEIREEVESAVSAISAIQSCLDIGIEPHLENISNNSDRSLAGPPRSIPYGGPPVE
jgi:hypothetical protein